MHKYERLKEKEHFHENKESKEDKDKRIKNVLQQKPQRVYLDGNNMLFVDNNIRSDCLKKNRKIGEKKLGQICLEYCKLNGYKEVLLVFDRTKDTYELKSDGVQLRVLSAHPEFEISDDAFVEWAGRMNAEDRDVTLFVTSDRELIQRLKDKKVNMILKSGEFMKLAKEFLGEEKYAKCLKE